MKHLKTILKWIFGIICLIFAFFSIFSSLISTLFFLIAAAFLIPPFFNKIYAKTKINTLVKVIVPFVSVFIAFIIIGVSETDNGNEIKIAQNESNVAAEKENDSVALAIRKAKQDSLLLVENLILEKKEIEKLETELRSIKEFNGKEYRGDVNFLIIEVALFSTWGKMGKEAEKSENKKVKELGEKIILNLKKLQIKEFPMIRASYSKILKDKLWENDIEVSYYGKGNRNLQFTGGLFAANKNIKEAHTLLSEKFRDFRFTRVNYKWYKYDDEYTYYTISSKKDSEIMIY